MSKALFLCLLHFSRMLLCTDDDVDMASLVRRHHINDKFFYTTYTPYNFSEANLALYRPHIDKPTHPIRPRRPEGMIPSPGEEVDNNEITVVKQARGRSIFVLQKGAYCHWFNQSFTPFLQYENYNCSSFLIFYTGKMRHVPDWDTFISLGLDKYPVLTMNNHEIGL